jgi:hypothetical protein
MEIQHLFKWGFFNEKYFFLNPTYRLSDIEFYQIVNNTFLKSFYYEDDISFFLTKLLI